MVISNQIKIIALIKEVDLVQIKQEIKGLKYYIGQQNKNQLKKEKIKLEMRLNMKKV